MSLFQKAPATPEESALYGPLEIGPDKVLEMNEEEWYEHVYRGDDVPQLTIRAVLMGSFLGFFLAFTNLYIGLKTGWALGVAITACILSYAIWNFFVGRGWAKTPMTILENNCMQSSASAAGYSTGGTMVSAIAALLMMSVTRDNPGGEHLGWVVLTAWTLFLAAFGTVLAIPMKRNMINQERLKFPSGTAAAVTLQSLYSEGSLALKKARALFTSATIGAIFPLLIELKINAGKALAYAEWHIFDFFLTPVGTRNAGGVEVPNKPSDWTMVWDVNPVMIAAGALVGLRIALYMVVGGLVLVYALGTVGLEAIWVSPLGENWKEVRDAIASGANGTTIDSLINQIGSKFPATKYAVLEWHELGALGSAFDWATVQFPGTTNLVDNWKEMFSVQRMENVTGELAKETRGAITHPGKGWKELGLWLGVPIMLSYGLLQFATQWRTIFRALGSLGGNRQGQTGVEELAARTEVPFSWFSMFLIISSLAVIWTANTYFEIPFYLGALAIVMTFFLALVAARATGESDITPVGAMGKIMQLTFGTFIPSGTANLMSASITANGAGCCADLLNDLKSGYLLGANPRRQFAAQMMGILAGTAATVTGFYLLVPDATALMGQDLPDGTFIKPEFPAPAAQAWKAVADVMTGGGMAAMHPMHVKAIMWGLGLGALFLALEMLFPKKKAFLPSATGIGLGLILPFQYPLSMSVGALIAWYWQKKNKEHAGDFLVPVAAGLIAGISIMGVLVAVINTLLA